MRRPFVPAFLLIAAAPLLGETVVKIDPKTPLDIRELLSKPDSTVLRGPNGEQITVGEFRRLRDEGLRRARSQAGRPAGPEEELPALVTTAGKRLKDDFASASAAARAALATFRVRPTPRPLPTPTPTLGQIAHKAALEMPCDRVLFNVEGAAINFQIQPGLPIVLKGCFKNTPTPEVRIVGNFPPYGFLLLNVVERGDDYIYGTVPAVTGVPDQPISIFIRFVDGSKTNERMGSFRALRSTVEITDPVRISQILSPQTVGKAIEGSVTNGDVGYSVIRMSDSRIFGTDTWVPRHADQGFQVVKMWRKRIVGPIEFHWAGDLPQMAWETERFQEDTWVLFFDVHSTVYEKSCYGITRLRIEGPVGLNP